MADDEHDDVQDDEITKMIESGQHGTWHEEDGHKVFTPRMTFFLHVPPHRLASYFVEHGQHDLRLNLA